jgi:hypothetical protein
MVLKRPPGSASADTPADARDLPHRAHQRLVGLMGLSLPVVIYLLAAARPTPPLPRWELLRSISAYYYTGAISIFVGVLFALGLLLISYPGYEGTAADRILARIAGGCALGVGVLPTSAPVGLVEPPWWRPIVGGLHLASAAALLICFAVFSLWLFRKSDVPEPRDRPPDKRRRDAFYLACGVMILIALLWCLVAMLLHAPVFWPEAIALWAFGFSWLVKGRAIELGPYGA